MQKIAIVGAGFSGSVIARELAERGYFVDVFDAEISQLSLIHSDAADE